jgi:hypothetical protein
MLMKKSIPSGRPTVEEVNLGALEFNCRQIKKRIPAGVMVLALGREGVC